MSDAITMPVFKNEINLNSIISAITLVLFLVAGVTAWNNGQARDDAQDKWIEDHVKYISERNSEVRTREGTVDQRISNLAEGEQKLDNEISRIKDQVISNEKGLQLVEDLRKDIVRLTVSVRLVEQAMINLQESTGITKRAPHELRPNDDN